MIQRQSLSTFPLADEHILTLEEQERLHVKQLLHEIQPRSISAMNDDAFLTDIALKSRQMPQRLARHLINFRKHSNAYGALLFRNFLLDQTLPLSPPAGQASLQKTTSISEYTLLLSMMWLGEPIAYADEKEGMLIQNIVPIKGQENRQENTGSAYLEFHTEDGFHPHKPDFVGLICLRADHDRIARTATASIRHALPGLDTATIARLRQPEYRIRFSSSFLKDCSEIRYSHPLPILSGHEEDPEMCVDFHAMEAINPQAQQALEMLKTALTHVLIDIVLVPGDLIIIDNRVAAHARTAFQPRYDGHDRWLQRLFVVQDYRKSRAMRINGGHVCMPITTL